VGCGGCGRLVELLLDDGRLDGVVARTGGGAEVDDRLGVLAAGRAVWSAAGVVATMLVDEELLGAEATLADVAGGCTGVRGGPPPPMRAFAAASPTSASAPTPAPTAPARASALGGRACLPRIGTS
jgi:hypothetical protein